MSSNQPNIVYIFSDQHRHDAMGCAGNDVVQTPTLDRLANEGLRFERTYCQSPLCMPSRASVVTGLHAHQHGITKNFVSDFDPQWPNMMRQLQQAGYLTSNFGKTHFYHPEVLKYVGSDKTLDLRDKDAYFREFGFDHSEEEFDRYLHCLPNVFTHYTEYLKSKGLWNTYTDLIKSVFRLTPKHWDGITSTLPQEDDLTSFIADRSIERLKNVKADQPFFMMTSFIAPHVPLMDDPIWAQHYQNARIPFGPREAPDKPNEIWARYLEYLEGHSNAHLLTDEYVTNGARHYYGMISLMGQRINDIIQVLEDKGVLDNTWIVYSADHGEMLGDHGLMAKLNFYKSSVQVPALIRPPRGMAPKVEPGLTESVDLTATILDIAGAERLERSNGQSLLPFINGQGKSKEAAFSAIGSHASDSEEDTFLATFTERYRYTLEINSWTPCEFFDLQEDPDEMNNLVNDTSVQGMMKEMDTDLVRPHLRSA